MCSPFFIRIQANANSEISSAIVLFICYFFSPIPIPKKIAVSSVFTVQTQEPPTAVSVIHQKKLKYFSLEDPQECRKVWQKSHA
jgi:hypothetical protein